MTVEARMPVSPPEARKPPAWSVRDTWIGMGLAVGVFGLLAAGAAVLNVREAQPWQVPKVLLWTAPTAAELIPTLLPVLAILLWRKADVRSLGFRHFAGRTLALGCGLAAITYMALMVYGLMLAALHVRTQAQELLGLLGASSEPYSYVPAAVVAAPFAEEIFFRGFFFQGLRQKYGWNRAAIISSLVFGAAHGQLAALLPTFVLGYVLAFVYQRSNSIWPGIILHFVINSVAMGALLAILSYSPGL